MRGRFTISKQHARVSKLENFMSMSLTQNNGFQGITESEYELSKTPAMACLTVRICHGNMSRNTKVSHEQVLWKFGDRLYQSKVWSQAADWFLLGTHRAFASISEITSPKCLRKAALCYLEQREYARAVHTIQRCPQSKASTYYLTFLAALYQGTLVLEACCA